MRTIKDLDNAGVDLRVWCYRCQREKVIASDIWIVFLQRGWSIDMIEARPRFRCKRCEGNDQILLVGARRVPEKSWSDQVHHWFFASRSKRLFTVKR